MPRFVVHLTAFLATIGAAMPACALAVTLDRDVRPLLQQFCYDCHNAQKQKGDLNLEPVGDDPKLYLHREIWEKVAEMIETGEMPPEKKPQPSDAERDLVVKYIDGELSKADCKLERNPGKVTIRRLNREEYRNTIRDLLFVDFEPKDFPNDAVGYGFDNIGDVLSLAPMLMEKYLAAAEEIVNRAIVADPAPKSKKLQIKGSQFRSSNDAIRPLETRALGLYREGEATTRFDAALTGEYTVRVRAFGEQAGLEPPRLALRIDGRELKVFDVPNTKRAGFEAQTSLDAGAHTIAVAYLNNYSELNHPDEKLRGDRNLFVEDVEIVAPAVPPPLPVSHQRLITRMPQPGEELAAAREILGNFARRAYRRPVSEAEVERLSRFVKAVLSEKGTFLEGMQVAMQAALCSPHFLYRWELDSQPMKPGEVRELSNFELASRLSYFLWSSMPDDELFALAEKGELCKDGTLRSRRDACWETKRRRRS
jgi:hypothetical protein